MMMMRNSDNNLLSFSDVMEDATNYLAVLFLQPRKFASKLIIIFYHKLTLTRADFVGTLSPSQKKAVPNVYLTLSYGVAEVIQVCKCMKNVFVQCELWCDEILRRFARPCCACSRHVSVQALADLAPAQKLRVSPGSSRAFAPGYEISLTQCPSKQLRCNRPGRTSTPCPGSTPTSGCLAQSNTTQYLLLNSPSPSQRRYMPSRLKVSSLESFQTPSSVATTSTPMSKTPNVSSSRSFMYDWNEKNVLLPHKKAEDTSQIDLKVSDSCSFHTPASTSSVLEAKPPPYWQRATTMCAKMDTQDIKVKTRAERELRPPSAAKRTYNSGKFSLIY